MADPVPGRVSPSSASPVACATPPASTTSRAATPTGLVAHPGLRRPSEGPRQAPRGPRAKLDPMSARSRPSRTAWHARRDLHQEGVRVSAPQDPKARVSPSVTSTRRTADRWAPRARCGTPSLTSRRTGPAQAQVAAAARGKRLIALPPTLPVGQDSRRRSLQHLQPSAPLLLYLGLPALLPR